MALFDNQSIDNDDGHEQQQQQQQQEQESPKMVKLSLMAYFDDMCRYQNYLSSYVKCKLSKNVFFFLPIKFHFFSIT